MTEEQRKRIHDITYSTEDREELAERIVRLEDENKRLRDKKMLLAVDKLGIGACYDNLSAQYKELESENARLRSCLSDDAENARQIMGESRKMRELLDGCAVLLTDRDFLHWPELCEEVLAGMRELGIEVKE